MPAGKVRFTIWLEQAVYEAAQLRAQRANLSVSVVLADAAKETLLQTYRTDREAELLKAVERIFYKLQRFEQRSHLDHRVLQEMAGLAMLSFFNHTPAVPDSQKNTALVSGKLRFERYLDLLASNIRGGQSVLGSVPTAESESPPNSKAAIPPQPSDKPPELPKSRPEVEPALSNQPDKADRGLFDPMPSDAAVNNLRNN